MATLSQKDRDTARGFLLDLFYAGGLIQDGDTSIGNNLSRRWTSFSGTTAKSKVQVVCTEILQRNFDFFNVDAALNDMSSFKFFADPTAFGRVRGARMITRDAGTLANYIAYFCKTNGIYWDDINTHKTTYEMDQYRKTLIGGALWNFECFLSQNSGASAATNAPTTSATSTRAPRTPRTPGQAPANPYKSLGPQSGNIRDLKGKPGQKVQANTRVSFCIVADNAKSASPAYALIKPLTKGADVNGTNKVFVSSSHGYTDCTCYFDDVNDADKFLAQCQARNWGANISNLRVVKKASESNGYFLVGTEFGVCAISAKRMNEMVAEEIEPDIAKDSSIKKDSYKIADAEVYAEALYKYE